MRAIPGAHLNRHLGFFPRPPARWYGRALFFRGVGHAPRRTGGAGSVSPQLRLASLASDTAPPAQRSLRRRRSLELSARRTRSAAVGGAAVGDRPRVGDGGARVYADREGAVGRGPTRRSARAARGAAQRAMVFGALERARTRPPRNRRAASILGHGAVADQAKVRARTLCSCRARWSATMEAALVRVPAIDGELTPHAGDRWSWIASEGPEARGERDRVQSHRGSVARGGTAV